LTLLVECQVSPVEDENLVQTLEVSKFTVKEIKEKMAQVTEIFRVINETRDGYRPIATRGSVLFYVVSDVGQIDPMYQYSLQYIVKLFRGAITATKEPDPVLRKAELIANVTKAIYRNVSRGLFEQHKLIFSFLISVNLGVNSGLLPFSKLELFLKGAGIVDKKLQPANPDPKVLTEDAWDLASQLSQKFPEIWAPLVKDIAENFAPWKATLKTEDYFRAEFPCPEGIEIKDFDRLLLVKMFRPDRLFAAMSGYIRSTMGAFYVESLKWDIEEVYQDSDYMTPIIFVITQGSDPASMVKSLGERHGFPIYEKLMPISLGQGQGRRAASLISKAVEEGTWVLLENCHLARTWMGDLETIIQNIQEEKHETHPEFRLFITSMPASYFSVSILQNGIKVTTEPPRGVKANVVRAVSGLAEDYFERFENKPAAAKLTSALCLFHAVLRERRKFGPLGWNILYEFNDSDVEAAKSIHEMFLEGVSRKEDIPWDSINLLVGQITYGGRITDDLDRRLLMTILGKFYTEQVLDDRYKFCSIDEYRIPKVTDKASILAFGESLPSVDDTEVFGFHRNANISFQTAEITRLIDTIISVLPKDAAQGTGEDAQTPTAKVTDLINMFLANDGLPQPINVEKGNKDLFKVEENGLIPSLSTVLLQEIYRFNKLLTRIRTSLSELSLAVQGKNVMSAELDELFNALLINKVPGMWAAVAYPSLKPLASWFKDLCARVAFINGWLMDGFPKFYWLPGSSSPRGS
jgi:dynein heavy chain